MRYVMTLMVLLGAGAVRAGPLLQEEDQPVPPPKGPAREGEKRKDEGGVLEKAVELKIRVRKMRESVLGGGPAVEKAEREALAFYRRKIQENARRVDDLRTTQDAKEAEYHLALDATLGADSAEARDSAARLAASLRAEIASTEQDIKDLERQRAALGNAAAAVQARIERRKRIVTHFEEVDSVEGMPFLGTEALGPDEEGAAGPDPFADRAFLADLLRLDPKRARAILFERDPARYWKMFPLTPPEEVLRRAIAFPAPDFPGRR